MLPERLYWCRCVLKWPDSYGTGVAYCGELVNPDQPFCQHCEARHPEEVRGGVQVLVLAPDEPHPAQKRATHA
jgi:hypothetical protein